MNSFCESLVSRLLSVSEGSKSILAAVKALEMSSFSVFDMIVEILAWFSSFKSLFCWLEREM